MFQEKLQVAAIISLVQFLSVGGFDFTAAGEAATPLKEGAAAPGNFDWPQWRGTDRNSISKETGWTCKWPAEGPKLLWKMKMGCGFSSVAISRGCLYTEGTIAEKVYVYCLNAATGEKIWQYEYVYPERKGGRWVSRPPSSEGASGYGCPGPTSTPTVDGDRVYSYSRCGQLFCLDAQTGKEIWTETVQIKSAHHGIACSPLILGNLVIVLAGGKNNVLLAYDKVTGKLAWAGGDDDIVDATSPQAITYKGEPAVTFVCHQSIWGISAKDGKTLFFSKEVYPPNERHPTAEPVLVGNKLYCSSQPVKAPDGKMVIGSVLYQLPDEPGELKPIWQNAALWPETITPILWQGCLYSFRGGYWPGPGNAVIHCVDFQTGEIKWSQKGNLGPFSAADGKLIILSEGNGELIVAEANPDKYVELARAKVFEQVCSSPKEQIVYQAPVLSNGRIYCRSSGQTVLTHKMSEQPFGGWLICLDVSGGAQPSVPVKKKDD